MNGPAGVSASATRIPAGIACFGDSITVQGRWVQPLTDALAAKYPGKVAVTNHGICGNRLLSDAPSKMPYFAEAGLERVKWDAFSDYGITHMIVALGGNDIGLGMWQKDGAFSVPVEKFEAGCRSYRNILIIRNLDAKPHKCSKVHDKSSDNILLCSPQIL